jgi:hypothetical protein
VGAGAGAAGVSPRGFGAPDWVLIGGAETRAGDPSAPAPTVTRRDQVKHELVRDDPDFELKDLTYAASGRPRKGRPLGGVTSDVAYRL